MSDGSAVLSFVDRLTLKELRRVKVHHGTVIGKTSQHDVDTLSDKHRHHHHDRNDIATTTTAASNDEQAREHDIRTTASSSTTHPSSSPYQEVRLINELEYVPTRGLLYANAWYTDTLLEIDPNDGRVVRALDFSSLYPHKQRPRSADCLNGIAHDASDDTFYLTGKLWPLTFQVKIHPPCIEEGGGEKERWAEVGGNVGLELTRHGEQQDEHQDQQHQQRQHHHRQRSRHDQHNIDNADRELQQSRE